MTPSLLNQRIADVRRWYALLAESSGAPVWRTEVLLPMSRDVYDARVLLDMNREEATRLVECVCRRRENLLNQVLLPPADVKGRLLMYEPGQSLYMAAASSESDDFLSWYDAPPWDVWLAFLPGGGVPPVSWTHHPWNQRRELYDHLVSWVPDAWVDRVQAGMHVIPEGSLTWLELEELGW